jgi:hypothetical protein
MHTCVEQKSVDVVVPVFCDGAEDRSLLIVYRVVSSVITIVLE